MRPTARWLLVGALAGGALASSTAAPAAHLPSEARVPGEQEIGRDPGSGARSGTSEGVGRPAVEAVAWIEREVSQMSRELDDLTVTALEPAGQIAERLWRGTRTGATEVHHAYLAVTTMLTSLGRCLEAGMAASPFGPAGPRTADPPSGPAGAGDPCGPAGPGA